MKTCKQCYQPKSLDDYYAAPGKLDGKSGKCKECIKSNARSNRAKNVEYYREYDRNRGNRQHTDYLKKYRNSNPMKYKAHSAVGNALRDGRINKSTKCEKCGCKEKIHGHHDDYSKPLEVRWLCAACHRQWHVINGEAKVTPNTHRR